MKDSKRQFLLTFVALPVMLITALAIYLWNMTRSFEEESIQSLEEISVQGANAVQTEINNKMYLLQDLASVIELDMDAEPDVISQSVCTQLMPVVSNHGLYTMGIITEDGTVYSADGSIRSYGDFDYLDALKIGTTNISGRIYLDGSEDSYANIYSTPILDEDTSVQKATLFAVCETDWFRNTLEVVSYGGEGYSYLVDSNGDVVVDSGSENSFTGMTNLYTSMADVSDSNSEAIGQVKRYIQKKTAGYLTFKNQGVRKYMYCMPIGVNGWYLLTVVPASVMNEQLYTVVISTVIFGVIILLIYSALFIFIINQQKRKQEDLETLVYVDPLTGGYTFAKFQEEYGVITRNNPTLNYALVSMDLSKFEMLNDLYGYEEGNRIIVMMEALWQELLHDYECCGHRMADRFILLLTYENRKELLERLKDYRAKLQERVEGKYKLDLIMGIYEIRGVYESFEDAFNRVMVAFSTAKNGTNNFAFYDEAMEEGLNWERYVEDYFQTALKNHEFQVYYQAKVDTVSGKVSGAEALVRWVRQDGSIVAPGRFVPVLENNGSIAELDRYMFQEVLNDQKKWLEDGVSIVPVSVNLSRVQLAEQNFVDQYRIMLENSGVPAEYISLEFTESAMFDNEEILKDTVNQLHELGMKVLIDDFGVGFSSMMTLKTIPIDVMKMDKTFVDSIGDERGNKIVVGMIEFAISLGMTVTAEGVEQEHQYQFLRTHHCNDIQGYYFAKPIPANEYYKNYLIA